MSAEVVFEGCDALKIGRAVTLAGPDFEDNGDHFGLLWRDRSRRTEMGCPWVSHAGTSLCAHNINGLQRRVQIVLRFGDAITHLKRSLISAMCGLP